MAKAFRYSRIHQLVAGFLAGLLLFFNLLHGCYHSYDCRDLIFKNGPPVQTQQVSAVQPRNMGGRLLDCLVCSYHHKTLAILMEPFLGLEVPQLDGWSPGMEPMSLCQTVALNLQQRAPPQLYSS